MKLKWRRGPAARELTTQHRGAAVDALMAGVARGGSVNWSTYGVGMSTREAMAIPSVARGVGLVSLFRQCSIEKYSGDALAVTPRFLKQPDPNRSLSWFVGMQIKDYVIHGNALSYVTVRGADGWPLAVTWLPASLTGVTTDPSTGADVYSCNGQTLRTEDVIHVQRDADDLMPRRGIGIIEQHCATLRRVSDQEAYEASMLNSAGVPSVALTSPNAQVGQDEIDNAKARWMEKFGGPVREPAILPAGTIVEPLGWSPADSELTAARQMSLTDVANLLNLDGYWLGAPATGLTYRSAGPKYLELLRQTIGPILADFEGEWSAAWLPWGSQAKFRRSELLGDDMQTTVQTWVQATGGPIASMNEARPYLGLPLSDDPDANEVRSSQPVQIVPAIPVGGP